MKKKYRIAVETEDNGRKIYVVQEKEWFFWKDSILFETGGTFNFMARYWTLEEAKEFINSRLKKKPLRQYIKFD